MVLFQGKTHQKLDRSAAYAARHIAKNLVASGLCSEVLVQISYAIGIAKPVALYINTYQTTKIKISDDEIAKKVFELFDLRPYSIIKKYGLKNPIFQETASLWSHGKRIKKITKTFQKDGKKIVKEVELFSWEKLDYVPIIKKKTFKLKIMIKSKTKIYPTK